LIGALKEDGDTMNVLIIGALGQLGKALCTEFQEDQVLQADLDSTDCPLDITDHRAVLKCLQDFKADLVINTAAYHDLVHCESHPDKAFAVNAAGAMGIAQACRQINARLVSISTDYVFGGDSQNRNLPYRESDLPQPLNVYGTSKLAGEHLVMTNWANHLVIRTAALYSHSPCRGKGRLNFVETMIERASTGAALRAVDDEWTTPTTVDALAHQIKVLAEKAAPGLYHATCKGACTWYEFAQTVKEILNLEMDVLPVQSREFQIGVRKATYTVLDNYKAEKAGLDIMPHWRDALKKYAATRCNASNVTA
jgi:dTDP-4-dehydrorhamnose reductase